MAVLMGDAEILLARGQGQYYAINNVCSDADAACIRGNCVLPRGKCDAAAPGRFCLRTGYPPPGCSQPVPVYPSAKKVRIRWARLREESTP